MGSTKTQKLWSNLPYTLALLGTVIVIAAALNLFLQRGQAVGGLTPVASYIENVTDRQITTLQGRLRSQPQDPRAYTSLGGAYLQKARETGDAAHYARAEQALSRALELDPSNARTTSLLGSLALTRHQFVEALDWAERSLELNSYYAPGYGVKGDAQVELGRYEAAADSYQAMIDLKPNLDSYARASLLRKLTGDVAGAIEAMQAAIAAGLPGSEATAWARVQLGNLYFDSGRTGEAEQQYRAALQEFDGYYLARFTLGKARAGQKDYDEAATLYEQAADAVPQPSILAALGDLYAEMGELEQAQLQYDTVEQIARLAAVNQQVYNRELARFYADHDIKLDQALDLAQRELAVRQDIYGYDTLAWALHKNQRNGEARNAMAQALSLGTQDPILYYHAGKIYAVLGDDKRAIAYLEHALALNPQFSLLHARDARRTLSRLISQMPQSSPN